MPELKSKAERANRTIKEMTKEILLDSGLPSVFWYRALLHVVYVNNMLPTKTYRGYIGYIYITA